MWPVRFHRRRAQEPDLCPVCGGDFVNLVDWLEADETHTWVRLRCGECETWRADTVADDVLDRYEQSLDDAARKIAEEADRQQRNWRSTEADAFAAALDRDLIDAGDFGLLTR